MEQVQQRSRATRSPPAAAAASAAAAAAFTASSQHTQLALSSHLVCRHQQQGLMRRISAVIPCLLMLLSLCARSAHCRETPFSRLGLPGTRGHRKRLMETKWIPHLPPDCPFTAAGAGQNVYKCAMGFAAAAGVTGGLGKPVYVVTSDKDSFLTPTEGMLRWGVNTFTAGVHVVFSRSMTIHLEERIFLSSNTTIDGRGFHVNIQGAGLVLQNVTNVILENLEVGNQPGDHDVIPIRSSNRVWADHLKVYNASRGTIDVVYNSSDVTISNCYIHNYKFTMLLGAEDVGEYDKNMRVTIFRNWFDGSGQRQPHCRWGECHVVNNLYTEWLYYCVGGRMYANVRSEYNVFVAGDKKEVTPWFGPQSVSTPGFDYTSTIRSYGDRLYNGATFHEFPGAVEPFVPPYTLDLHHADMNFANWMQLNVGPVFE